MPSRIKRPKILQRAPVTAIIQRYWTLRQIWCGRHNGEKINIGKALRELKQMQKELGLYRYRHLNRSIEQFVDEIVRFKKPTKSVKRVSQVRYLNKHEVQNVR